MPDTGAPRTELWHGQPCVRLQSPCGDTAVVALQGAQVLSWVAAGRERLYLSPAAVLDGHTAIRGGIPLCFPQFNARGPLRKHGFARNLPWKVASPGTAPVAAPATPLSSAEFTPSSHAVFVLSDSASTRAQWPHGFAAHLTVVVGAGSLRVELSVRNTDTAADAAWDFTTALHTYLRVNDVAQARVKGLAGQARWDAVTDTRSLQHGDVRIDGEYDSVFAAAAAPLQLDDGESTLQLHQSVSLCSTVVWNPGAALCAALPDMPPQGYAHMLCIEAAQIDEPVRLAPQATWTGWQQLSVVR